MKRAKRSFVITVNGRQYPVHPTTIYADDHGIVAYRPDDFEDVFEEEAVTLTAPTGFVIEPGDTTAFVNWESVSGAVGYLVETDPATEEYSTRRSSVNLVGLTQGTSYEVSVVALGGPFAADSAAGTDEFETTALPALDAPENVTASNIGQTTADVSWDAVTGADDYLVSTDPATIEPVVVEGTTTSLTGLSVGTSYEVSVVARGNGFSDSAAGTDEFETDPAVPLGTPQNVAASNVTISSADVAWDAVDDAEGYTVSVSPAHAAPQNVVTNSASFTGLTDNTSYTVSVVATTSDPLRTDSAAGTDGFQTLEDV